MTAHIHEPVGLLLPEDTLTSPWFLILGAMVAFNTIVYVGLSVSKIIPLPHQLRPNQTRALLHKVGLNIGPPGQHRRFQSYDHQHPDEPVQMTLARREIPHAVGLMGCVVMLYVLAGGVAEGFHWPALEVAEIVIGAMLILNSIVLIHQDASPRFLMWGWSLTCVGLVAMHVWEAYLIGSDMPIIYSLLIVVVAAPVSLAWKPAITAGLLMVAIITLGGMLLVPGIRDFRIAVMPVVCLVISLLLLRLRLSVVDAITEERTRLELFASTDQMTGCLSRHGLTSLAAVMAANAEREGDDVYLIMIRLRELADINRSYGHDYADTALQAVGHVLQNRSRAGDLVARWSGSRFVMLGMGEPPSRARLAKELIAGIEASGVATGKRPLTLALGMSCAAPTQTTLEHMIEEAIADLAPADELAQAEEAPANDGDQEPGPQNAASTR